MSPANWIEHRMSPEELYAAVEAANVPTLLMLLVHQTGDLEWLSEPFRPKAGRGIEDPDDGGLPPDVVAAVREAAFQAIGCYLDGVPPALGLPSTDLTERMLSIAVGEPVVPEYGEMIRDELSLAIAGVPTEGAKPRRASSRRTNPDAIIIGAGVSGIAAAVRLSQIGLTYSIVERNRDFGGVWTENRYPGAAVDTPSHLYSYSFSAGDWPLWFSPAPVIHNYLVDVATERGIAPHVRFGVTARSARFDSRSNEWVVEIEGEDGLRETIRARVLISAVGAFNTPSIPPIPGREKFAGPSFHSAGWPADIDLTGRRVAVIGNGASAMQIVPAIAYDVDHLTVFQLEPHWIAPFPRFRQPVPDSVRKLMRQVPLYHAWYRARLAWLFNDKLHSMLRRDPAWPHPERAMNAANDRFREYLTSYIKSELGERTDLLKRVLPTYPPLGKRLLLDNGWYRALRRDNVDLVGDMVTAIDEHSIATADGRHFEVDVIVYATGFNVVSFLSTLSIVGRSGRSLSDTWQGDDASAYLGLAVPDFPNLFILYGPNTQTGHGGSLIALVECQLDHISRVLAQMEQQEAATVEVRRDTFERYIEAVDAAHAEMVWTHPGMETYYRNSKGRVVVNNPYRVVDFWSMTRSADISSYEVKHEERQAERSDVTAGPVR